MYHKQTNFVNFHSKSTEISKLLTLSVATIEMQHMLEQVFQVFHPKLPAMTLLDYQSLVSQKMAVPSRELMYIMLL